MRNDNTRDPLPEHFTSIKEASEFWDTHDAGDYEDYLRPVHEELEVAEAVPYAVLLEHSVAEELKRVAQCQGVSLETLVNVWLEEKLTVSRTG